MTWPFATRKQMNRIEFGQIKILKRLDRLAEIQADISRSIVTSGDPAAIIDAASKCFTAGYEAAKVESYQVTQPIFFNAEARERYRREAESSGTVKAGEVLSEPGIEKFLNDED